MDISEFLELSAGKWFSQRTIHQFDSGQLQAGKSTLIIETLKPDQASVIELCQASQVDPAIAWGGLQSSWDGTSEGTSQKQVGSALIVPLVDPEIPNQGQFLQARKTADGKSFQGHYHLDEEEVLTFITESDQLKVEERLWYLIPNLRLRTTVIQQTNGPTQAAFCSEIRMLGAK
ncbi:MAG: phycobiliprotein lyase [Microcoleaceae cyanobacterium]